MVKLGLFIGLFALILSMLGFLSVLSPQSIGVASVAFFIGFLFLFKDDIHKRFRLNLRSYSRNEKIIISLLILASIVNLWGALVPEIAFDSIWYHLTIPKLYLEQGEIFHIPGSLLYYSGFPKLIELIYLLPLSFKYEIGAKVVHYLFGLTSLIFITIVAKEFVSIRYILLVPAILASNLVFAWESTVAFNDLAFTFYEILSFYCFTKYVKEKKFSWVILLGLMLGFAVLAKSIAILSVIVYSVLIIWIGKLKPWPQAKNVISIIFLSVLPSLPWFVFNYFNSGNAIYPFGSGYLDVSDRLIYAGVLSFIKNIIFAQDPISPAYIIFLPFSFLVWKKLGDQQKIVFYYVVLTLIAWLLLSSTGGSRFLLPFLPVYSIGVVIVIEKMTEFLGKGFYSLSFSLASFLLIVCIGYRVLAQADSINYFMGQESKMEYLTRKLNFSFGDFYDTEGDLEHNLSKNDLVLVVGAHNLYYINFPFVHSSWYKGEEITHILTQNTDLPMEYSSWPKIYSNQNTGAVLYKNPN